MTRHQTINAVISVLLGATLLAALCFAILQAATWNWSGVWAYRQVFWRGWLNTIWISLAALALSVLLGLLAALGRRARYPALRWLATPTTAVDLYASNATGLLDMGQLLGTSQIRVGGKLTVQF